MESYNSCLWIGIGASAGGLEAITALCQELPVHARAIYIVAQHLSPSHSSMLSELIQRKSRLKVKLLQSATTPQPGTIYVTPPQRDVIVRNGKIELIKKPDGVGPKPNVTTLFTSLAEEVRENAVGIILSGTGSDGALGIKAIHEAGGTTIAESEKSAKHNGMPEAARETRCVDFVLPASDIGAQIGVLAQRLLDVPETSLLDAEPDSLDRLFGLVQKETGISLRDYKKATLNRRFARRMLAVGAADFPAYVDHVAENPKEAKAILADVLISVTRFMRDRGAFDALGTRLAAILAARTSDQPVRIWSVGCATGEEAYSIAMLLAEQLGGPDQIAEQNIRLFATDIDEPALAIARKGVYSEAAVADLPEVFVRKYFNRVQDKFEILKSLRELILFASHNIIEDPPFQKIDLLVCRNLLIYFEPALQEKIYRVFYYSLKDKGVLFLGKSESTSSVLSLFDAIDAKAKIYGKKVSKALRMPNGSLRPKTDRMRKESAAATPPEMHELLNEALIKQLGDASVLVDESLAIERFYGDVTPFLSIADRRPSWNLPDIVQQPYRQEIRALCFKALRSGKPDFSQIRGRAPDQSERITRVQVYPLVTPDQGDKILLVSFTWLDCTEQPIEQLDTASVQRMQVLETELAAAREHLQTVIEELETTNEELQSTNEELQSSNEELQSSNEELETTNEELQSTNEELMTMNDELQSKTTELERTSTQLLNIKNSLEFPLIVVDARQVVLRANRNAREFFPLLAKDGLWHEGAGIAAGGALPQLVEQVMKSGRAVRHVIAIGDVTFSVHVTPFHDSHGEIGGAILSLIDITESLRKSEELEESKRRAEAATIAKADFLASMSHEIRTPLNAIYGVGEILGRHLDNPAIREKLLKVLFNSTRTLKQLLDDVLDFSRLEAGQMTTEAKAFSIRRLVDQITSSYSIRLAEKDLGLHVDVIANVPDVLVGDPLRIGQILGNLLSNAIKFTHSGEVRVAITGDRQGDIFYTKISVSDSGIGMSAEQQQHIFEKFSQANVMIGRKYGGTGLGLAIVSELCKLLNGKISVTSAEGIGSIFHVDLPLRFIEHGLVEAPVLDIAPIFDSTSEAKKWPVLVVEDNLDNQLLLQMYLDDLGCEADIRATIPDAVDAILGRRYAAVLLDIQVGTESGFELMKALEGARERGQLQYTPAVFALTAHVHDSIKNQCREAGMAGFLTKPIDRAALRAALAEHFDKVKSHADGAAIPG